MWVGALVLGCAHHASWDARNTPRHEIHTQGEAIVATVVRGRCRRSRCEVVVLIPGGSQNRQLMEVGLRPFAQDLADRGWIVVSPAVAVGAAPFHRDPERLVPVLRDTLRRHGQDEVHLIGISNGGLTALALAAQHPELIASTLVMPGLSPPALADAVASIDHPVLWIVGSRDRWAEAAQIDHAALIEAGVDSTLHQVEGAGHLLFGHVGVEQIAEWLDAASRPENPSSNSTQWSSQ